MAVAPTLTVTSDCLLTGIDPALEQELKNRLTIDNPAIQRRQTLWPLDRQTAETAACIL